MNCVVRYSKVALRDLDRVWSEVFNASKSREIAERYVNGLMDKVEAKADFPQSGAPLYYQDSFTGYYYVVFKAYLAFYRLEENVVFVDRILLGRSDYMRHLIFDKQEV